MRSVHLDQEDGEGHDDDTGAEHLLTGSVTGTCIGTGCSYRQ